MRFTALARSICVAAVVLAAASASPAADPPVEPPPPAPTPDPAQPPARKARPAATRPADPAEPADVEAGEAAVRTVRRFLLAVGAGDDKAAYDLAAPALRDVNTLEQFAKRMNDVRAKTDLSYVQPVTGLALTRPPEGQPRRAILATGEGGEFAFRLGAGGQFAMLAVELVEHDGRWLVADVRDPGPPQIGMPMGSSRVTLPLQQREYAGRTRRVRSAFQGEVTAAKNGVITVKPKDLRTPAPAGVRVRPPEFPADGPERTFKLDEKTKYVTGVRVTPNPAPPPQPRARGTPFATRYGPGSAADVKVGALVAVGPSADGDRADSVRVEPNPDVPPDTGGPGL